MTNLAVMFFNFRFFDVVEKFIKRNQKEGKKYFIKN